MPLGLINVLKINLLIADEVSDAAKACGWVFSHLVSSFQGRQVQSSISKVQFLPSRLCWGKQ